MEEEFLDGCSIEVIDTKIENVHKSCINYQIGKCKLAINSNCKSCCDNFQFKFREFRILFYQCSCKLDFSVGISIISGPKVEPPSPSRVCRRCGGKLSLKETKPIRKFEELNTWFDQFFYKAGVNMLPDAAFVIYNEFDNFIKTA